MVVSPIAVGIMLKGREIDEDSTECVFTPNETVSVWFILFTISMVLTLIISVILFVFVEKQGINARIAFKNKF